MQAIQALGLIIYHALDYGLGEHEERHLSRDLERLLEVMINPDEEDEDEAQNAYDEGIEKDAKESNTFLDIVTVRCQSWKNSCSLFSRVMMSIQHLFYLVLRIACAKK